MSYRTLRNGRTLEVIPLATGWRLSDCALSPSDPHCVIAFVSKSEDGVDVLWLDRAHPVHDHMVSMDAVLAACDQRPAQPDKERVSTRGEAP